MYLRLRIFFHYSSSYFLCRMCERGILGSQLYRRHCAKQASRLPANGTLHAQLSRLASQKQRVVSNHLILTLNILAAVLTRLW